LKGELYIQKRISVKNNFKDLHKMRAQIGKQIQYSLFLSVRIEELKNCFNEEIKELTRDLSKVS